MIELILKTILFLVRKKASALKNSNLGGCFIRFDQRNREQEKSS